MKFIPLMLFLTFALAAGAQGQYADSLTKARKGDDSRFLLEVLNETERGKMESRCYFKPDENYIVNANFTRVKGKKFAMPMTKVRNKTVYYRQYGKVTFTIRDTVCELSVYENLDLKQKKEFRNYLFLPFRDATSGELTYGGGRFIDLEKTKNGIITIDFNTCYNPYCAYSERYSCPLTPKENKLEVGIFAGTCYEKHD